MKMVLASWKAFARHLRQVLLREWPGMQFIMFRVLAPNFTFFDSNSQVIAAFDPSLVHHNGSYLEDGIIHNERAPSYGLDEENADKLWELSEKIWGVKF